MMIPKRSTFWKEVWDFCGIVASVPYEYVIDESKRIDEIPEWFPGASLNYAENLLKRRDDKIALCFSGESTKGATKSMSFSELYSKVEQYAASLRAVGVRPLDRVAGYMPNCFESVIAALATASIGAIWSSTSVDFGVMGVLERFKQVKPKVLFSVEAVIYNQRRHEHTGKLREVVKNIPELERVVVIPFLSESPNCDISSVCNSIFINDFLDLGRSKDGSFPGLVFEQVSFSHPLFIMFSSGTTGYPKCMVHSVGGTLIKHLAEHVLQLCVTEDDTVFFYTTVGWMMWNWLISALAIGATVVLYDGSPFMPRSSVLFDLVDETKITVLGMGAKCFAVAEQKAVKPRETHDLSSLTTVLSTGSPLNARSFDYIYRDIKADVLIGSISGNPCVEKSGELVCEKAFPSMPTHFLNDPNGERYQNSYFRKFPGVWCHGDFMSINPKTNGILMLGRRVCLFVKMADGHEFSESLREQLKHRIRFSLSAKHVPHRFAPVKDIPLCFRLKMNSHKQKIAENLSDGATSTHIMATLDRKRWLMKADGS